MATRYSFISPGTELAFLTDRQDLMQTLGALPYPRYPGYAAVGEVLDVGSAVTDVRRGDLVFAHTPHQSVVRFNSTELVWARVPADIDLQLVPLARMASVSVTVARRTTARAGDWAMVIGLGPVGNAAAQCCQAMGLLTIGVEIDPTRLELARRCSIKHVVDGAEAGWIDEVRALTGGGPRLIVECTGSPDAVVSGLDALSAGGELFLVGAAWLRKTPTLATDVIRPVFGKFLQVRSGWEWAIPRFAAVSEPTGSIAAYTRWIIAMIADGTFRAREMVTQVIKPGDAASAYQGLQEAKDQFFGVLIDWTSG